MSAPHPGTFLAILGRTDAAFDHSARWQRRSRRWLKVQMGTALGMVGASLLAPNPWHWFPWGVFAGANLAATFATEYARRRAQRWRLRGVSHAGRLLLR